MNGTVKQNNYVMSKIMSKWVFYVLTLLIQLLSSKNVMPVSPITVTLSSHICNLVNLYSAVNGLGEPQG